MSQSRGGTSSSSSRWTRSRSAVAVLLLLFLGAAATTSASGQTGGGCEIGPSAACAGEDFVLADLGQADLRNADLRGANFNGAYLHGANLRGADLRGADLRGADLGGTDLRGARLAGANLAEANLRFAKLEPRSRSRQGAARAVGTKRAKSKTTASSSRTRKSRRKKRRARRKSTLRVMLVGAGRVVSSKARIHRRVVAKRGRLKCPGRCRARFKRRSVLNLVARAQPGYRFARWKGATRCRKKARCKVRLRNRSRVTVAAVFKVRSGVTPIDPVDPIDPIDPVDPVDPVKPVCKVPQSTDSDDDGLPDCMEIAGWQLTVSTPSDLSANNGPAPKTVSSDPQSADTDGDGLRDGDEFRFNSDPGKADSDLDGLRDRDEIRTFLTLPNHADSDGDSKAPDGGQANPHFFDGNEVSDGLTSPRLADTDGDGISDLVETVYEATNPRVADLPKLQLIAEPGTSNPQLDLDYEVEETTGTEKESAQTTGESSSSEATTERSRETTKEHTFEYEVGGKCKLTTKETGCSVEHKFTNSWTNGTTEGSRSEFSNGHETSREYEKIARTSAERKVTLGSTGCIQVVLSLRNAGGVALSVSNLEVLAWTPDPDDPNGSKLLTALLPIQGQEVSSECPATAPGFGPVELPPGSKTDVAFSQQVDTGIILDYMAEPTPIEYELGAISMKGTDMLGKPVDFSGEIANKVTDRTASIEVNFGDGAIENYSVAANSPVPDGQGGYRKVTLGDALGAGMSDLDPTYTDTDPVAIRSLTNPETGDAVENQSDLRLGVWNIFGDAEGIGLSGAESPDWRDIPLKPGDAISLVYTRDSDDDELPDGYEAQIGTDPDSADSDGDGLTDYFEARVGWTVPFARGHQASYKAFPNPLNCDVDDDGSPDGPALPPPDGPGPSLPNIEPCPTGHLGPESERLTDPLLTDTNEDGLIDGDQALPDALRAVGVGGRMPVEVRTWGGEGMFGPVTEPTGIAVDGNQPLLDADGRPVPVDSYVTERTPMGGDDLVAKFTGNPRAGIPWRHSGSLNFSKNFFPGNFHLSAAATGIAVAEGQVGSGDNAGSPVIVNWYTKGTSAQTDPGSTYTNAFITYNGLTGESLQLGEEQGILGGIYGGTECCFGAPYRNTGLPHSFGNGQLDSAGTNTIVIAHGWDSNPGVNGIITAALPTQYVGRGDLDARMTRRFGVKSGFTGESTNPDPGQLTNPSGIAIDRVRGKVYVADNIGRGSDSGHYNLRSTLTRFDLASGEVEAFATFPEGNLSGLQGIAIDPSGEYLYATSATGTLFKFSSDLAILGRLGSPDNPPFEMPRDVDVDNRNGIWVVDSETKLIHFYFYPFGS